MRCFIGIEIEPKLTDPIKNIQNDINDYVDATFVKPDNLHFTLAFLGDVQEKNINEIRDSVESVIKNIRRKKIDVGGLGVFPNKKFVRILWVGSDGLENIAEAFNSILCDNKKPVPHVTIARIKNVTNKKKLIDYIESNENLYIGKMNVNEIKLKKSVLTPKGPIYSNLMVFELE